jgi:hypothetical protein
VIDATEGGALKQSAAVMTLADAASQFCGEEIDRDRFDYLRAPWHDGSKLAPARAALASRREELELFRSLCEETRGVLDELTRLMDKPAEFNRRIARVDELRTLVQKHGVVFDMVRDVSQMGELQKFAADRRLAAESGRSAGGHALTAQSERLRAERQLQRDKQLVESLLQGCGHLAKTLDETLARFDEALEAAG